MDVQSVAELVAEHVFTTHDAKLLNHTEIQTPGSLVFRMEYKIGAATETLFIKFPAKNKDSKIHATRVIKSSPATDAKSQQEKANSHQEPTRNHQQLARSNKKSPIAAKSQQKNTNSQQRNANSQQQNTNRRQPTALVFGDATLWVKLTVCRQETSILINTLCKQHL